MKNIAILGFGREGKAVLKFLKNNPIYKDVRIEIRDKKFGNDYLRGLEKFDIIFRSPGIPYTLPEIQHAKLAGVKVSSAMELFFSAVGGSPLKARIAKSGASGVEHSKYRNCQIIGITGTKGKSTTATLLYKILHVGRKDTYLAGNIGKPALYLLPRLSAPALSEAGG